MSVENGEEKRAKVVYRRGVGMKRIAFIVILIITGCKLLPNSETSTAVPPSMSAFEFSNRCSHVCWLGINPTRTTAIEAKSLIASSNQIDKKSLEISDAGISAVWLIEKTDTFKSYVRIQFHEGLVTGIGFSLLPFTMNDFISQLGQPDKISIWAEQGPDGSYVSYAVYYLMQKTRLYVTSGDWNSPDPFDTIYNLDLNVDFKNNGYLVPIKGIVQPWLGYGHIKDYLPGVEIPPTNQP
jgi:hypothetical protein